MKDTEVGTAKRVAGRWLLAFGCAASIASVAASGQTVATIPSTAAGSHLIGGKVVNLSSPGGAFDRYLAIAVLNVGQGNCIVITCPDGLRIVNDCGRVPRDGSGELTKDQVKNLMALLVDSAKDYEKHVLVTHPHDDHLSLIADDVISPANVSKVWIGGGPGDYKRFTAFQNFLQGRPTDNPPDRLVTSSGVGCKGPAADAGKTPNGIRILSSLTNAAKTNDKSVAISVRYGSFHAIFTGDGGTPVEAEALKVLTPDERAADLLVLTHHGTHLHSNMDEWVEGTKPKVVVTSSGRESRYGHPRCVTAQKFMTNLADGFMTHDFTCFNSIKVSQTVSTTLGMFNTADSGSVLILSDGESFGVWTCSVDTDVRCTRAS
jgi:beta-lactamase superfamily II metal-dependent hydrolase